MKISRFNCRTLINEIPGVFPRTYNLEIYGGGSNPRKVGTKLSIEVYTDDEKLQQTLETINESNKYEIVRNIINDLEHKHEKQQNQEKIARMIYTGKTID